jgi:carbamoyl-phosphate synthase large subunit
MLYGKRVFVSGGAGVIGTSLIKKLHQLGAKIYVGDLKPRPISWKKDIIYRQGDLNYITKDEMEKIDPEYFFHLAATFERSIETRDFWEENFHHNIKLSHHLMTCLNDCKSLRKVIFASSYLIYDPHLYSFKEKPNGITRLKEIDPIYPRNTCGAAKLLHEIENRFLEGFPETIFKTVSARIFRVYGKGSCDVISRWVRALINNETITVYKEDNRFDFIFADDVAEGIIRLATSTATGVINLGTDNAHTVNEVLAILKNNFPELKINHTDYDIPYEASQANMDLFMKYTSWKPATQLKDGIAEIIRFERDSQVKSDFQFNVLITSISKKIPLLKCVRRSSQKIGNKGKIIGADSDEKCIGRYFVDSFWQMPKIGHFNIQDLIDFCKNNKINCIIPTRDGELSLFAENKDLLKMSSINTMISNNDTIRKCIDKIAFYEEGIKHGFPIIETSPKIDNIKSSYYVVKERCGSGSRQIGIRLDKQHALSHSKLLENPVFQPFIEGKEFSLDLYVDKSGKTKGVVARTRDVVVNGESQVTETIRMTDLEKLCSNLAEKLGIYGHAVIQVLQDESKKYHIIECNPRFGGASSLSMEVGLDSFYWFFLESGGADLDEYEFVRSQKEKKQVRFAEDLII